MLAALVLAAGCAAPSPFPLAGPDQRVTAGVEALVDPDLSLRFSRVTAAPGCNAFVPVDGQPNFGAGAGGVWLRFHPQLPGGAPEAWRLVVRHTGLEQVCVHWPLAGGAVSGECVVRSEPSHRLRWSGGRVVFPLPAGLNADAPIHVYAESDLWLKVPLEIATVDALAGREAASNFRWGLYYGVLAALIATSLAFYFGRRDGAFLYFALHLAVLTLALAVWQGRFVAWEPAGFGLTRLFTAPLVAGFLALGARFYQTFLETRQQLPVVHGTLEFVFWFALATGVMSFLFPVWAVQLLGPLSLLWLAAALAGATSRARQGHRPALWVIAAVSVLLFAIFLNALSVFNVLFLDAYATLDLAYAGNLIASSFLVFALVYRVRSLAAERDHASELALASQRLALHRAHFDELTALPKRTRFREAFQQRLVSRGGRRRRLAVITIGLDRFRSINHAMGHEGGDAVLSEIAARLREHVGPGDVLARVGPAAFAVLTEIGEEGVDGVERRTEAWCRELSAPLHSARGATLSASAGVAVYPDHATSADLLLRHSDETYYRARDRGSGAVEVFNPLLHQTAEHRLELLRDLRHALANNALDLHFQPMRAFGSGDIVGAEALLRWQRDGQSIPPDRFIPIAEQGDLISPLTDWVFKRACSQLAEWRRRGLAIPFVSVNVSATQFRLPGFSERVEAALAEHHLPGDALMLEITESVLLVDLESTRRTLAELRERGVRVAVDDFGVGYSSLSYLRTLPVQCVKIDRSFLHGVPEEPEAVTVIGAIIALGQDLGLTVIAEGIESSAQHDFLAQRAVAIGQGFWIARAMPAAEFALWHTQRGAETAAA